MDDQPKNPQFRIKTFSATVVAIFGLINAGSVLSSDQRFSDELFHMAPVSESELEKNRGGFVTRNGVRVDFGFEKAVFVNGVSQFRTALNFDTLNAGSARNNGLQLENGALQQASVLPTMVNVIDNTRANQLIQEITTLNIRFSNIGIVQRSGFSAIDFGNFPAGLK